MKQEYIDLLRKDIAARLPYKLVVVNERYDGGFGHKLHLGDLATSQYLDSLYIENTKVYLRPMSSMTEEERKEYTSLCNRQDIDTPTWSKIIWHDTYKSIDWLNKKMFAYRTIDGKDMFELGLALEAPEGMYK